MMKSARLVHDSRKFTFGCDRGRHFSFLYEEVSFNGFPETSRNLNCKFVDDDNDGDFFSGVVFMEC